MVKFYAKIVAIILFASILVACEIIVPREMEVKEADVLALYKDVPLKDVMNNVQKKFHKAKEGQIYFYSPNNYRVARTGIQTARAYFRDPEKRTSVLTALYRSDKALDDAAEVKKIVERELSEHIKVRDFLDSLEAKKSHTREYRSLITTLMGIVERIEKDKEDVFKDPDSKKNMEERKKDMMAQMLDFRLRIVKFNYLNHGERLIAEADSYDAKVIAPVTYQQTIAARNSAVKYVTENVENLEGIADIAKKFQYEAERLLHITRAVHTVLNLEKDTQEQYILKQEENMERIAEALREPKIQYHSFAAQSSRYAGIIKRLTKEKQDLAMKVADLSSGTSTENTGTTAEQADGSVDASVAENDKPKKGLEIVPIGGDPDQIRNSLRILTDQVYQLTVEKNAWENERASLKSQIKKLKTAKNAEVKPAEKPKAKPEAKKASEKKSETSKEAAPAKKEEAKPADKVEEKAEADKPATEVK